MGYRDTWVSNDEKPDKPFVFFLNTFFYLQNQPHSYREKDRQTDISDVYYLVFDHFQYIVVQHWF